MKKRRIWLVVIILLIITNTATFLLSNSLSVVFGNKVLLSTDNQNTAVNIKKMLMLKNFMGKNYYKPIKEDVLIEGALKGMFNSIGDPYTQYMTPKEYESFTTETEGSFGGIGIQVTVDEKGVVTVVAPIEDTPGEKAGLKSGDKIVRVNGEDIIGLELNQVVEKMKGDPGTDVSLTIIRDGKEDYIEKKIVREIIRIKTVKSDILKENLGYLRITMFDRKTAEDFKEHLKSLKDKNIKGLIIDLRSNPGGLLNEVVEIADDLLGKQTIVYTEDREGNKREEMSDEKNKVDVPIVVLVNGGSASASEILSGAIKDTNAGTLVGTTTFGKGLVQNVEKLSDGSAIKYTSAEYFTPNGINIHGKGIKPDIVVEMPEALKDKPKVEQEEDPQLKKAIEVLESKISIE